MPLRLTTQATFLTGSRAIAQALNAVVGMVAVRTLAKGDFATFRQVYLLHMILMQTSDFGVSESLFYFVPRDTARRRSLLLQSICAVLAAQALTGAAFFIFRDQIAQRMNNPELAGAIWGLVLFTAFSLLARIWEVQLVSEARAVYAAVVISGFETLRAGLLFLALFLRPSIDTVLIALVVGSGAKVVAFAVSLLRLPAPDAHATLSPWKERMTYAMGLWLPGSLNVAAIYAHQLIVSVLFDPEQFAIYSVACFQIPFLAALTLSAGEVLLVRVTRDRQAADQKSIVSAWQSAIKKAAFVFIPIAVLFVTISAPLMTTLFTKNYRSSAPLFALMIAAIPLQALFQDAMLRGLGAMRAYSIFYYIRVALSLFLGAVLTMTMGLWGAALSTVLTLLIHNSIQVSYLARTLSLSAKQALPWSNLGKILLASVLSALPAIACVKWITYSPVAAGSGAVLFGITYLFLSLFVLKTLGDETPRIEHIAELWRAKETGTAS